MSETEVIPAGGEKVVGNSPERRVEILSDDKTLAVTWSRFGPQCEGADLHVHKKHTDLFYVLDGELTLRLGLEDEPVVVSAGKLVCVPPLVVHGFRNGSDANVRYLNFHAPGMQFAEYLRALRDGRKFSYDQYDPPANGGRPTSLMSIGTGVELEHIAIAERQLEPGASARAFGSIYVLGGSLGVDAIEGAWLQMPPRSVRAGDAGARYLEIVPPGRG